MLLVCKLSVCRPCAIAAVCTRANRWDHDNIALLTTHNTLLADRGTPIMASLGSRLFPKAVRGNIIQYIKSV